MAALIAKTTVATGGTTTPAWIASPAGKTAVGVTCGGAVNAAVVHIERVNEGDENDNPDRSDQKNVDNAEDQAIKDAEAERDAAFKAMQENPTYENRKKFHDGDKRHGCLTGQLVAVCDR